MTYMLPSGLNTYAGLLVSLIALVVNVSGYDLAPGASDELNQFVLDVFQIAGLAYAAYGRAKAQSPGWLVKGA